MVHHVFFTALLIVAASPIALAQQSLKAVPSTANANTVTYWTDIAGRVTGLAGPKTVAQVAMHDALNAIRRRFDPYQAVAAVKLDQYAKLYAFATQREVVLRRMYKELKGTLP